MKRGISALEILVALAILALLAVLTMSYLSGLKKVVVLDGVIESLISLTREAKSRTLAPEDSSRFGVRFEPSKATLFKGAEFVEGSASNKTYALPADAEIFDINFPGGDLVFQLLTGEPNIPGDFSVRLKADLVNSKTIFINSAGLIYVE